MNIVQIGRILFQFMHFKTKTIELQFLINRLDLNTLYCASILFGRNYKRRYGFVKIVDWCLYGSRKTRAENLGLSFSVYNSG